jgi:hypothetical protein
MHNAAVLALEMHFICDAWLPVRQQDSSPSVATLLPDAAAGGAAGMAQRLGEQQLRLCVLLHCWCPVQCGTLVCALLLCECKQHRRSAARFLALMRLVAACLPDQRISATALAGLAWKTHVNNYHAWLAFLMLYCVCPVPVCMHHDNNSTASRAASGVLLQPACQCRGAAGRRTFIQSDITSSNSQASCDQLFYWQSGG